MASLPVPAWVAALVVAAMTPFAVRTFAAQVEARARARTRRALERIDARDPR